MRNVPTKRRREKKHNNIPSYRIGNNIQLEFCSLYALCQANILFRASIPGVCLFVCVCVSVSLCSHRPPAAAAACKLATLPHCQCHSASAEYSCWHIEYCTAIRRQQCGRPQPRVRVPNPSSSAGDTMHNAAARRQRVAGVGD